MEISAVKNLVNATFQEMNPREKPVPTTLADAPQAVVAGERSEAVSQSAFDAAPKAFESQPANERVGSRMDAKA